MPANTQTEMILGFSVILGVLVLYVLSLIFRFRKAQNSKKRTADHLSETD